MKSLDVASAYSPAADLILRPQNPLDSKSEEDPVQTVLTADCLINCCLNFYRSFAVVLRQSTAWLETAVLRASRRVIKHLMIVNITSDYRLKDHTLLFQPKSIKFSMFAFKLFPFQI